MTFDDAASKEMLRRNRANFIGCYIAMIVGGVVYANIEIGCNCWLVPGGLVWPVVLASVIVTAVGFCGMVYFLDRLVG